MFLCPHSDADVVTGAFVDHLVLSVLHSPYTTESVRVNVLTCMSNSD